VRGSVLVKSPHFDSTVDTDGKIDQVILIAKGERKVIKTFDTSSSVLMPTGFINIQTNDLPALDFAIRAKHDIFIELTDNSAPGGKRDWLLNGFVGGLTGFDAASNITLRVQGALTVQGGIVAADVTAGQLSLRANSISSDGASVFIAQNLVVDVQGAAQLNTLVEHLTVDSRNAGDISVNEATDLIVDHMLANNGRIDVISGGNLYARDIRNVADFKDIVVKSGADIYVDYIEAATSVGALKRSGTVTVDGKGTLYEWQSAQLPTNAVVTAVVPASASAAQSTQVAFASRTVAVADVYGIQIDNRTYEVVATAGSTVNSLLMALATKITAGEANVSAKPAISAAPGATVAARHTQKHKLTHNRERLGDDCFFFVI
jgi:hypothetical protein